MLRFFLLQIENCNKNTNIQEINKEKSLWLYNYFKQYQDNN